MRWIVEEIERLWNSDDPIENAIGFLGKLFVEAGLFFVGAVALGVLAAAVAWIAGSVISIDAHPLPLGLTVVTGVWLILLRNRFCDVIRDRSTDDESGE